MSSAHAALALVISTRAAALGGFSAKVSARRLPSARVPTIFAIRLHARAPRDRPLTASVPPASPPPRPTPQPARRVRASRAVTAQAGKADGAASEAAKTAPAAGGEKAKLPKEYTYHTPGSVQETDDEVVFAHQTPRRRASGRTAPSRTWATTATRPCASAS